MRCIMVFEFMIKDLELSGLNLLLYALIYGFSQHGHICYLSENGYCKSLGCSRATFYRARKTLFDLGFISYKNNGLICNLREDHDVHLQESLDEMIRIAKTPWLDK